MKKNLPLILVGVGVLVVLVAGLFLLRNRKQASEVNQEETVLELPQNEWPAVSLTPTEDPKVPNSLGHFLDFRVQKINVAGAASMDYLLVYNTKDGGQQGVPGTVKLTGGDIEKLLLMGSASSGKYRFDAGVSTGTMTITFRDGKGKSMGRLTSQFNLQSDTTTLTSSDGSFKYTLDKPARGVFFVTMNTFIEPTEIPTVIWQNGFGIYASDGKLHTGKVS